MNRKVSLPLLFFLCFLHQNFGQPAKRDAPPATEFALEYLSKSGGFSTYSEIPAVDGLLGIGTGPGSDGHEPVRKGIRVDVTQDPPGTLRIHLSIADDIDREGRAGANEGTWRDAGDYTLQISENETLTLPGLEEYGFFQLRIVPANPAPNPLRVTSVFTSLEVVSIEEVIRNHYRVFVRNVSERPVYALYGRFSPDSLTGHGAGSEPLIAPGQTREFGYSPGSSGERIGNQTVQVTKPQPELRFVAVYYGDGACEGEASVCAQIAAEREADRIAASAEVAILEKALAETDPERFLREAYGRGEQISPEAVKRVVEQTLARFPATPPSSALDLENTVKSTLKNYDRHYGSVLDGLRQPDPNAVAPDIRKLIQDRIRERKAFAATP